MCLPNQYWSKTEQETETLQLMGTGLAVNSYQPIESQGLKYRNEPVQYSRKNQRQLFTTNRKQGIKIQE